MTTSTAPSPTDSKLSLALSPALLEPTSTSARSWNKYLADHLLPILIGPRWSLFLFPFYISPSPILPPLSQSSCLLFLPSLPTYPPFYTYTLISLDLFAFFPLTPLLLCFLLSLLLTSFI